ncbi:MAG: phosphotransferase [Gammaproteobacteria bacterium]|nr:phosphotransferase [Gammaproteobacteria bacterium]
MKRKTTEEFLENVLAGYHGLEIIAGDASFRRYFRVWHRGVSYIVMDAPPEYESVELFVQVATGFAQAGIHVPEVIDADFDDGYLLLSDFGDQQLQSLLTVFPDKWLGICLEILSKLQTQGGQHFLELPEYDGGMLLDELGLFPNWFVTGLLKDSVSQVELGMLENLYQCLVNSALNQPQVWVHRDYHSRNLMKTDDENIGVIDFQDAVLGPITYDLVSLLKDCYVRYPKKIVTEYLKDFYIALVGNEMYAQDFATFERLFDLMGLQRHLKVLGIFARLSLRDGKHAYLNDLPLVFDYVFEVLSKYPEFHSLLPMFERFGEKLETKVLH